MPAVARCSRQRACLIGGCLIPTECEFLSLRAWRCLTDTVEKVARPAHRSDISGILITRSGPPHRQLRRGHGARRAAVGDMVFDTVIAEHGAVPADQRSRRNPSPLGPNPGAPWPYREWLRSIDRVGCERLPEQASERAGGTGTASRVGWPTLRDVRIWLLR